MIESVFDANSSARFILVGDLNYNIYDLRQPMSIAINELLAKYDLICTHDFDPSFSSHNSFTRCSENNGSYTLLDYIFVSRTLRDNVKSCRIHYDGGCPSDHFPVEMDLEVVPQYACGKVGSNEAQGSSLVSWPLLTNADVFLRTTHG